MDLSFEGFRMYAAEYNREYPTQRVGQALFNALFIVRSDLAEMVRSTDLDPFYRDEVIGKFLKFVEREWNGSLQ
jgi:hypothetical protein